MELLYCFANVSLTQRMLDYLRKKIGPRLDCVTVIFLDDLWIVRLRFKAHLSRESYCNCVAVFNENGLPYKPAQLVVNALHDLNMGSRTEVARRRHKISIVSHGEPDSRLIYQFQKEFIAQLGYCPKSLA